MMVHISKLREKIEDDPERIRAASSPSGDWGIKLKG